MSSVSLRGFILVFFAETPERLRGTEKGSELSALWIYVAKLVLELLLISGVVA